MAKVTPSGNRARVFHELHRSGCFVIPNPWNVGNARLLAQLGFKALATTSSGFAWSIGKRDNGITLEELLGHLREMSAAVDVPINADFEDGFAAAPEEGRGERGACRRDGHRGPLHRGLGERRDEPALRAPARGGAHRRRASRHRPSGTGALLVGRSEGFIRGQPDSRRRSAAHGVCGGGADCLYAPGLRSLDDIGAVVRAVAPKPVNVLVATDFTTVRALADIGVRRISVGGALARAAWAGFFSAAREIAGQGTFHALAGAVPSRELENALAAGGRS